ncbi:hypothetical protein [Ensifer adhaerens]|uniref:hypothetical protein n=1 Tax=Ensifer adhaerens TaxID=106592 RepID=UPI00132EEC4E|nr:hypothetical protein [Ensifer adhaerens]QHG74731.1 hypothetical protein DQW09_33930 [Ensifer adhaerens]
MTFCESGMFLSVLPRIVYACRLPDLPEDERRPASKLACFKLALRVDGFFRAISPYDAGVVESMPRLPRLAFSFLAAGRKTQSNSPRPVPCISIAR